MRRMILPLLLLVAVACQPATMELTEEQRATVTDELTQAYTDVTDVISRFDGEAWLGYFESSGDMYFTEFGEIWSWSMLADTVRAHWPGMQMTSFAWGDLNIQVLAPDVGIVTTTFDESFTDAEGTPMDMNGTFTAVWVRTDTGWKIVNASVTLPQPEPSYPEST